MTTNNYTQMSNDDIITLAKGSSKNITWVKRNLLRFNPKLWDEIVKRTKFLDEYYSSINKDVPTGARFYCLRNYLTSHPKCANPECSNPVAWNGHHGFHRCCCHDCSVRDPIIKQKSIETCKEKYGTDFSFQSELVKDKIKKTLIARIGVDNPQKNKEIQMRTRLTNEKRYGGSAPACSHEVLRKMKTTCEERYGVSNFSFSPLFSSYHRKRIFHDGIYFDSTWEVSVYEFCKMNNIKFEYSPSITYEYEYDGKIYTYHPDFLIDGKVYEVKGDNFFRINESTGMEEMYCPWRYSEWSDEHYNWMCGKYEAKHQCMLKNNVVILREGDMKNLEMRVKHTCVDA